MWSLLSHLWNLSPYLWNLLLDWHNLWCFSSKRHPAWMMVVEVHPSIVLWLELNVGPSAEMSFTGLLGHLKSRKEICLFLAFFCMIIDDEKHRRLCKTGQNILSKFCCCVTRGVSYSSCSSKFERWPFSVLTCTVYAFFILLITFFFTECHAKSVFYFNEINSWVFT